MLGGDTIDAIRTDYPYLSADDVVFARLLACPRRGRSDCGRDHLRTRAASEMGSQRDRCEHRDTRVDVVRGGEDPDEIVQESQVAPIPAIDVPLRHAPLSERSCSIRRRRLDLGRKRIGSVEPFGRE